MQSVRKTIDVETAKKTADMDRDGTVTLEDAQKEFLKKIKKFKNMATS